MVTQDIYDMVARDMPQIRRDRTDWEDSRLHVLLDKYSKLYSAEKLELERMKRGMKPLLKAKSEYYLGKASPEVYKEKPFDLKVKAIKSELSLYLDADEEMMEAAELICQQEEKVGYLERLLRDISNRGWRIKNIVAAQQFKHGLSMVHMNLEIDADDMLIT